MKAKVSIITSGEKQTIYNVVTHKPLHIVVNKEDGTSMIVVGRNALVSNVPSLKQAIEFIQTNEFELCTMAAVSIIQAIGELIINKGEEPSNE